MWAQWLRIHRVISGPLQNRLLGCQQTDHIYPGFLAWIAGHPAEGKNKERKKKRKKVTLVKQ